MMNGAPVERPLLIYDGECDFCKSWIARWRRRTGDRVIYRPFQEVEVQFSEIPHSAFVAGVQLIESDGTILTGADAVFRTLSYGRPRSRLRWLYQCPGFMPIARMIYNFIARHRALFSRFS